MNNFAFDEGTCVSASLRLMPRAVQYFLPSSPILTDGTLHASVFISFSKVMKLSIHLVNI